MPASCALMARDAGIPLVLQALFYPSVQLGMVTESLKTYADTTLLTWDLMRWFEQQTQGGAQRERWHREPLYAPSHAGVASAWIGLAQCDPLTDEGHLYAGRLRDAGVPVAVHEWPGVIHDFINMGRFMPEAVQAHERLADALKQAWCI
jgi:acetyl esterase